MASKEKIPPRARDTLPSVPDNARGRRMSLKRQERISSGITRRTNTLHAQNSDYCGPDNKYRISKTFFKAGMADEAIGLLSAAQKLLSEDEERPLEIDEDRVYLGGKTIGKVAGLSTESPAIQISLNSLLARPQNGVGGAKKILEHIPVSVLYGLFPLEETVKIVATFEKYPFATLSARKDLLSLEFYPEKGLPPIVSFKSKWRGKHLLQPQPTTD